MKRFTLPITVFFSLLATAALADGARYALKVDGLACPFCSYGLEKRLNKLEGVSDVEIDLTKAQALVDLEEGYTLDEATAKTAVQEAGFSLREFSPVQP